jgi:hypothetical protein
MLVFRHPVLFAILLAAPLGCAVADPGERTAAQPLLVSPYIGQQGRLLLGFKDPDVRTFSFASPTGVRVVSHGQLVAGAITGKDFVGAKLVALGATAAPPIDMRIADVIPPQSPDDSWQYVLEQHDASAGWVPACDSPTQLVPPAEPPPDPPRAVAMAGNWSTDGLYYLSSSAVTFACRTGVVGKCDGWGYHATDHPPSVTVNGLATSVTGPDMIQACTRMAHADYCATGIPNTLDGTPIHMDDIFTGAPSTPGFVFEAAWRGKAVLDRRPTRAPVVCLSKLRWSTLPLGGDCPLTVPDPRLTGKARFCDDLSLAALEQLGAQLYSSSAYIDAGLYAYTDAPTSTRLTTASLQPQASGHLPAWQIPPPAGVAFPQAGQAVQFEATIFAPALPPGLPDTGLIKLFSYRCGHDVLTTSTASAAQGCTEIAHEGYVYEPNTPDRAPLRHWHDPATGHAFTTATAATTMIANKWKLDEVVGGVIRAALDVNVRWGAILGATYAIDIETRTGEWIPACIDAAHIGAATSFAYHGVCVGAANRAVNHADILAFRIAYTQGTQSLSATQAYDGFSSDAYVDLLDATTTALAVHWNDLGNAIYAVDVATSSGDWLRCADPDLIANDTSYIHLGRCVSPNRAVKISSISQLRVCAFARDTGDKLPCAEAAYDGRASHVEIKLKQ